MDTWVNFLVEITNARSSEESEDDQLTRDAIHEPSRLVAPIFNRSILLVAVVTTVFTLVIRTENDAWLLRTIPLLLIVAAVVSSFVLIRLPKPIPARRTEGFVASVLIFLSLLAVDRSNRYPDLWPGFGIVPTSVIVLSLVVMSLSRLQQIARLPKRVVRLLPWIGISAYIPVFIQPTYGLLNLGDTTYHVLDEILAPVVGRAPYFDYSPQYSAVFGWLIKPISFMGLSANATMTAIIVACNVFIILIVVVGVRVMKLIYPRASVGALTLALVSVWCVSGSWNGASTQLKEFATFSRYLPFVSVLWAYFSAVAARTSRSKKLKFLVLGTVLGLALINNPESGGVLVASVGGSLIIPIAKGLIKFSHLMLVVASLFITALLFFGSQTIFFGFPSLQSIVGIRLGGSGLYEFSKLEIVGPHLIALAVAVAVLVVGIRNQLTSLIDGQIRVAASFQVLLGLSTLLLFTKYFFRPIPQSIPQFFVPLTLSAFLLVIESGLPGRIWQMPNLRLSINQVPLLALIVLPLGAMTQIPNTIDEFRRVTHDHSNETSWSTSPGRPVDGWSVPSINTTYDNLFENVLLIASNLDLTNDHLMYFGWHGNAVELVTSVENGLGIPAPESIRFGGNQPRLACLPVDHVRPKFVIVYRTEFPCSGYQLSSDMVPVKPFELMERID